MAYRKASEEKAAAPLGSEDFWAAVQNGADVRVSVADILAYLRATLRTNDIAELPGKLQAISDAAKGDLSAAVTQIDGLLDALQSDVDNALGQLDGSVSDKLDALQTDVNSRVSKSQLGAGPNLVPVLDAAGKLDVSTIPAVAITDTFPVASQSEMLALTAERGDIAIRSDLNKCFVLKAEPASTLANWKELLTPTDAVLSVVGLTGAITASALKAALGIAVSDVANLQASLDALSAADTKLRTDFTAADTAEAKARSDADTAEAKARADADAALETKKANRAGDTFTGGVAVKANEASGSVGLAGGSDTRTGYAEFRKADGSRMGYIGWGTGTTIEITAEAGIHFDFNSQPTVAGNGVWHAGNFDPTLKLDKAGGTISGGLTISGTLTLPRNGTGDNISFGDDALIGDVNVPNALGIKGIGDAKQGYIALGGTKKRFGFDGGNMIAEVGGNLYVKPDAASVFYGVWHEGNFTPSTKANLAGATFTGAVTFSQGITVNGWLGLHGIGTNRFETGNGDGASYSTQNVWMRLHFGLGMVAYDGSINGFYDARAGRWDTKAAPRVNGTDVWHPGNFNPATKADLGAAVRFAGVGLGNSEGYIYGDSNVPNVVVRTGASNAYRYSIFASDGFFTSAAGMRANGDIYATGRIITGEGQNESYVEMRDANNKTRYVHNNDGYIGFLGGDGGWKARVDDNGAFWTSQLGDLNTRIEDRAYAHATTQAGQRVWKGGDTMTGGLTLNYAYPTVTFTYPNVKTYAWQVREDGRFYVMNSDNGSGIISIGAGGDIWTQQLGDLNTRIEDRARAYAADRVSRYGDSMSGDLTIGSKEYPAITLLWGNVIRAGWMMDSDASLMYRNADSGQIYFRIRPNGALETSQFGDLNNRIETRCADFANDRAGRISGRLAYAGDLDASWNANANNYAEPYGGAVLTALNNRLSTNPAFYFTAGGRWRYFQMRDINMNWYTCGYV